MTRKKSSASRRTRRTSTSRSARPRSASAVRSSTTRSHGRTRARSGGRRYGPRASEKVELAMHEMKRGQLRSGRSGRKVTNPRQAVAIGLSKARREGAKVPPASRSRSRRGRR